MFDEIMNDMQENMDSSIVSLKKELAKLRTGRASTTLVDGIQVDYYGAQTPVSQVANVTTLDARTIQIAPWEVSSLGAIEKAILAANIGLTPQNDGKLIRISIPPLTEERRKEMVKTVKKMGEETKISVRNHRREANDIVKKFEKSKEVSEDDAKKYLDKIQTETDAKISSVDGVVTDKEKEIMTV